MVSNIKDPVYSYESKNCCQIQKKKILQITKKLCGVCASISQSQRFSNFLKHSDTDVQTKLKFIVLGIVSLIMASVVLVL